MYLRARRRDASASCLDTAGGGPFIYCESIFLPGILQTHPATRSSIATNLVCLCVCVLAALRGRHVARRDSSNK